MRSRRFINQLLATVFVLLMLQKAGGGLWAHSLLHQDDASHSNTAGINFHCNCAEDFFTNFATVDPLSFETPVFFFGFEMPADLLTPANISRSSIFLRGPPASVIV